MLCRIAIMALLADAELREDAIKHVVRRQPAGDGAEVIDGDAKVVGHEFNVIERRCTGTTGHESLRFAKGAKSSVEIGFVSMRESHGPLSKTDAPRAETRCDRGTQIIETMTGLGAH